MSGSESKQCDGTTTWGITHTTNVSSGLPQATTAPAESIFGNLIGSCEICGTSVGRMVRDHNHRTGMVRGCLCELCNSWLGVFESNLRRLTKPCGRWKYKLWVAKYQTKIELYLKQDKGVLYNPYKFRKKKRRTEMSKEQKMFGGMKIKKGET